MRFKLRKKTKIGLLILLGIGLIISSIFLYKELRTVKTKEVEQPAYTYKNTSRINYEVYLKPNILYSSQKLGEGQAYITSFVDYINVTFNHSFKGDRGAKISGNYNIIAQVRGYTGSGKEMKTIWSKDLPLVTEKNFNLSSSSMELKEALKLDYNTYNDFTKQVLDITKLNTTNELVLKMNINYTADTDKGPIKETFTPSLVIPINSQYFEIAKTGVEVKNGDIKEKIIKEIPANNQIVILYVVLLMILIASILFIIFAVSEPTIEDIYINGINRIFSDHGNRLVGIDSNISEGWGCICKVHSINDLVKICDEIDKPVMYKYSSDIKYINEFFAIDNKTIYMYKVNTEV